MSKYTYAGDFVNPALHMRVAQKFGEDGEYLHSYIECQRTEQITYEGHPATVEYWSPHTKGLTFEDDDEAHEYLEALEQAYEDDYDEYLEENHDSIVQMERYEQWKEEY